MKNKFRQIAFCLAIGIGAVGHFIGCWLVGASWAGYVTDGYSFFNTVILLSVTVLVVYNSFMLSRLINRLIDDWRSL